MLNKIINELNLLKISTWVINETRTRSSELFMIKKREDMRRGKDVLEARVTVYNDFEFDSKPMRGSASVMLYPGMTCEEISRKLKEAYASASYVKNPFFELPEPVKAELDGDEDENLICIAEQMRDALYENDTDTDAFINSAEIFAESARVHTVTSRGADIIYKKLTVKGEFVTQCVRPADVEMYFDFDYSKADTGSLSELSKQALVSVRDRANAVNAPKSGEYDVLLTDSRVATLMGAYLWKADASTVYSGYSPYKRGMNIQGEDVTGERLNLNVFSREPYSADGIPMSERPLIKDGEVMGIYGSTRFCRYLGIEPTGNFDALKCFNGTIPFETLKSGRVLMPVAFSDFQCDGMSGHFGGEIRLAYLFENGSVTLLTGGSINGSLTQKQSGLKFSLERYASSNWFGPKAVLIPGVNVAGI